MRWLRKAAATATLLTLVLSSQSGLVLASAQDSGSQSCILSRYLNTRSATNGNTEHWRPNNPTYWNINNGPYWIVWTKESTSPGGGGPWSVITTLDMDKAGTYAFCAV